MRKFSCLLLILISFFFGFLSVSAGVCEGKTMYDSGYCYLGTEYQYPAKNTTNTYKNRYYAKNGSSGYLGFAYEATTGTFSGSTEYAFCLDPAMLDPNSYRYGREIDILKSKYDKDVYKVYQYYVSSVISAKKSGTYEANKQKYLAFTDVLFRIYTAAYGYDLGIDKDSPYYYYSVLPYIIGNNKTALRNQVGSSVDSLYSNTNTSGSCKVTDKNLSKFSSCGTGWASSKDVIDEEYGVKTYFNTVFNGSNLWENPLTVTPKVETDSNGNYIFSFEVKFKKDSYVYFGDTYDYDIGYGRAFFNFLNFTINGVNYDSSYGTTVIPKTSISASNGSNANDTITYKLTMTKEKYDEVKTTNGKVDVKMKYKTYHPMSSDNVFVNYLHPRTENFSSTHQRMIVFTKFDGEKSVGISSNISTSCIQDGNTFKVNGASKSLEEYITACGCSSVNYDVLNNTNKTIYNNANCQQTKITVTSDLNSCDISPDKQDYEIKYTEERKINDYCSLTCTETVNINSLVSKNQNLSVKAGMYFKLPQYPELISTKTCTVDVKYTQWQNKYNEIIRNLPDLYNSKEYYRAASKLPDSTCRCNCTPCGDRVCCETCTRHNYKTEYNSSRYFNSAISYLDVKRDTFEYCKNDRIVSARATTLSAYNDAIAELNKLLNDLNTCTNTIKNMGLTNDEYYTFNNLMNFYYEQEYSKSSIGVKYNDERPKNVSDAEFVFDSVNETNSGVYIPSLRNYYSGINTDGSGKAILIGDSGIAQYNREVKYIYDDSRSNTLKYADSYTGEISSLKSSLKNPIELGYVYDIDITAKAKEYENYYQFLALGDENKIYNHFKQGKLVNGVSSSLDDLKRVCDYKVTNELMETGDSGEESTKLNIVYRIVDPTNIDPNGRKGTDLGFKNWDNTKGEVVSEAIKNDTFNPGNLEYSFELNSATLKEIREFNEVNNYSDFNLDCNSKGNECTSQFIKDAYSGSGLIFDKPFASDVSGSNRWKYMNYNESIGKWEIKLYNSGDMSETLFESLTEKLGGITP